jgi:hypothetical protein
MELLLISQEKDIASAQSMRSAIYVAMDIYKTRKFLKEAAVKPFSDSTTKT